jgi:hypothetical protein
VPHPFFDARRYPWSREDALAAHSALAQAVMTPNQYRLLYEKSGGDLTKLPAQQNAADAWQEILNLLTVARLLKRFTELVIDDKGMAAVHDAIRAIQNAEDLIPGVSDEKFVFVDRQRLRSELLKLLGDAPMHGVLLVRGPSGSGKSWTRYLLRHVANGLGEEYIYFQEGLVSTVDGVVDQLFAYLGAPGDVPQKLETDPAWYQRVCRTLQGIAKKKNAVCWVVADDLGVTEDGTPLMHKEIREFFEQFAQFMSDPEFAQQFRLVLLDYPDGDVPSKWQDFWVEDRPDEKEVAEGLLAEYLLRRAANMKKQIGEEKAQALARDVLVKADAPQSAPRPKPRLKMIHDELVGVIQKL